MKKKTSLMRKSILRTPTRPVSWRTQLEELGKYGALAVGLLYALGLIVQNLYFSQLHIRSLDLFRTRYILVGLYYCLFLGLHLLVPAWISKRFGKIVYLVALFAALILLDQRIYDLLNYHLTQSLGLHPVYVFKETLEPGAIWRGILLGLVFFSTAWLAHTLISRLRGESVSRFRWLLAAAWLIPCLIANFWIFTGYVFANLPETLGGAHPAPVEIFLVVDAPQSVREELNSLEDRPSMGSRFDAQLIYMDGSSLFLLEPDRFSGDVYELDRSLVRLVRFKPVNDRDIVLP